MSGSRRGAAIAALACLALFLIDALLVGMGWTAGFDQRVLAALRHAGAPGTAMGPEWCVPVAIALTALGAGIVRVPVTLSGAAALIALGRRRDAGLLVTLVGGGVLLLSLLKLLFGRARPDLVFRLVEESRPSFPSGHAMGAMLLYPAIGTMVGAVVSPRAARIGGWAGVSIALLVGLTRIFLGVHWTTDVIGGWAIGAALLLAALAFARQE